MFPIKNIYQFIFNSVESRYSAPLRSREIALKLQILNKIFNFLFVLLDKLADSSSKICTFKIITFNAHVYIISKFLFLISSRKRSVETYARRGREVPLPQFPKFPQAPFDAGEIEA